MAGRADETMSAGPERAGKGFRVGAQKDRYEEELLIMGGRFDLKVSGRDTGGDLCIYDTFRESKRVVRLCTATIFKTNGFVECDPRRVHCAGGRRHPWPASG